MAFMRGVSNQDLFSLASRCVVQVTLWRKCEYASAYDFSGLMNCQAVKTAFRASGRKKKNILLV